MRGKFITFEGAEGSGKSTQCRMAYEYLLSLKKPVLNIREPGGVTISEDIRKILLDVNNKGMVKECEVLLYMAARAQLVEEVILPALKSAKIILCDRFLDSTIAYQGYGNATPIPEIKQIGKFATQGVAPDLTLVFDIDAKKGLLRRGDDKDRIEQRPLAYHNRVRNGYLAMARQESRRIKVIEVKDRTREEIHQEVRQYLKYIIGI